MKGGIKLLALWLLAYAAACGTFVGNPPKDENNEDPNANGEYYTMPLMDLNPDADYADEDSTALHLNVLAARYGGKDRFGQIDSSITETDKTTAKFYLRMILAKENINSYIEFLNALQIIKNPNNRDENAKQKITQEGQVFIASFTGESQIITVCQDEITLFHYQKSGDEIEIYRDFLYGESQDSSKGLKANVKIKESNDGKSYRILLFGKPSKVPEILQKLNLAEYIKYYAGESDSAMLGFSQLSETKTDYSDFEASLFVLAGKNRESYTGMLTADKFLHARCDESVFTNLFEEINNDLASRSNDPKLCEARELRTKTPIDADAAVWNAFIEKVVPEETTGEMDVIADQNPCSVIE